MRGADRLRIYFFVFAGSKKCTRNSTDCLRCLRVQKNVPAMVLNVVILSVAKNLLPVNSKDNVSNLVIASRILPDMAISFAQCVMLSSAKHLLAGRLRGDSSLHSE